MTMVRISFATSWLHKMVSERIGKFDTPQEALTSAFLQLVCDAAAAAASDSDDVLPCVGCAIALLSIDMFYPYISI